MVFKEIFFCLVFSILFISRIQAQDDQTTKLYLLSEDATTTITSQKQTTSSTKQSDQQKTTQASQFAGQQRESTASTGIAQPVRFSGESQTMMSDRRPLIQTSGQQIPYGLLLEREKQRYSTESPKPEVYRFKVGHLFLQCSWVKTS